MITFQAIIDEARRQKKEEDIIVLIHSFLGKLYSLRHKIKKEINCDEES